MDDVGKLLGWISFALLGVWRIYWYVTEKQAESAKPKQVTKLPFWNKRNISKAITLLAFGIIGVQLLGVPILQFKTISLTWQIVGFVLVVIGLTVAMIGRYNLGTNWANCYDYQVKKKQVLVTNGIYAFIRHPVYTGIYLFYIGSELVAQSYLLFFYVLFIFAANQQAKWEESLLIQHFGEQYRAYMKRTKRFFPFIW